MRLDTTPANVTNPILPGNRPDPSAVRVVNSNGQGEYYLVHTSNRRDIPMYRSTDLISWSSLPQGAFARSGANPLTINSLNYCSIWAPQILQLAPQSFMLTFSAARYNYALAGCPAYNLDGGAYAAWASAASGQFSPPNSLYPDPIPFSASGPNCPQHIASALPQSEPLARAGCRIPSDCSATIRYDSSTFHDPLTGRTWLAYSWNTDFPPSAADSAWHGEHVSVVELDGADPFRIRCSAQTPRVHVLYPQDPSLLQRLRTYCPRCGEMLSNTKDRFGNEMYANGLSWGVTEGASLFRRGNYVYLLASGSGWDSNFYHVFWVAAPTVEELSYSNPNRLVGRYLIPSQGMAFGHGDIVPSPDCRSWYYLHHRLNSVTCQAGTDCSRDLWLSPIEFEDRGDGRGDVYIKPRFPAEHPEVEVQVPN